MISYIVIALVVLYQLVQIYRVNKPILTKGVPADDKYRFLDVGRLCFSYVACFGAICFLTAYTFVSDSTFFLIIGLTALATFLFCIFLLKEPAGAFEKEYQLSSVDREMMGE